MKQLYALAEVRRLALACTGLGLLVAALLLVQWGLLAHVLTAVVEGGASPATLVVPLAAVLGLWLARAGANALRDLLAARASSDVRAGLRVAFARALLRLGPATVGAERGGELVGTATEAVARVDPVVARLVPSTVAAGVVAPLVAVAVLVLDPASGALLCLTGPLIVVFGWLVGTHSARAAQERWETLGQLGALLVDAVRVLPTLVTFGHGRSTARWLGRVSESYRAATLRVLRSAFLSGFVLELGSSLCTALVAVTVGVRLFEGDLRLERGLFVLLLVPEFFAPLRALGADQHARLEGLPALRRLYAVLEAPGPETGTRPVPPGVPDLALRGVTVLAAGSGRALLAGVDLDLPAGSRTALVGPSGAGKTTLARLLLGFGAPDAGEVLLDGVPLREVDGDAWRTRVAYVPERPWLLAGSVADNVRLGRPDADDEAVRTALRRARALAFVDRLPQGLDTPLGEDGARLSGGERLRVALARALVADPALVVLDEPTSQLDAEGEADVVAALQALAEGPTLLVVTHRAAPLALADRVVRLVEGRLEAGAPVDEDGRVEEVTVR